MFNSKLFNLKLINYYYFECELLVFVEVGVYYSFDLEYVENVCLEVVNIILE